MAKSSGRTRDADTMSKNELLENEDRKAQKHRRKQFSEFLEEDEEYQKFALNLGKDIELDDDTVSKYLKK